MGGLVGGLVGGLLQSSGAKKAAAAQERAANAQIASQERMWEQTREDLEPWRTGGNIAQQALMYEMGLGSAPMIGGTAPTIETITSPRSGGGSIWGPLGDAFSSINSTQSGGGLLSNLGGAPVRGNERLNRLNSSAGQSQSGSTQYRVNGQLFNSMEEAQAYANANMTGGTEYGGYTKTPGYDFRLNQGLGALESSAAARGGLYSGAAMRDALQYGQDYATSEYNGFLNRLGGLSDSGQSAAGMTANANANAASGISNALGGIGNAQSAGAIGQANAWTNALGNTIGMSNYQNRVTGGPGINGNSSFFDGLFGGPGLGNLF